MVMAKPMKPKRVLTKASGEVSEVLEMVTPMVIEGKGRAGQGVNGGRCFYVVEALGLWKFIAFSNRHPSRAEETAGSELWRVTEGATGTGSR